MFERVILIKDCQLSKTGKGVFFRNTLNRTVSVSWLLLEEFNINVDNYKKLNEATITIPPKKQSFMYGRLIAKGIEDINFDPDANFVEISKEAIQARIANEKKDAFINPSSSKEFLVNSITLDEYQQKAFNMIKSNKISIITGFAGTGKSATVRTISEKLSLEGWEISRVAPTGKASKVIGGNTIHSWLLPILEINGAKIKIVGFKKDNMDENECLIIDEASMIDDELWEEVKRVWNGSKHISKKKIIFVGDQGQLKPVGEGEPFLNNIEKGIFPLTELKTIHRIKDNNEIIDFVTEVRATGRINRNKKYENISFINKNEAFDIVSKNHSTQMLTPLRNFASGSLSINKKIKELVETNGKPIFKTLVYSNEDEGWVNHTEVHPNDKIIIVKNLWEWDVTNGTTAILIGKERTKLYNHIKKTNMSRECYKFLNTVSGEYFFLPSNKKTRQNIELAYAITIHKSQGSEYNDVIIFLEGKKIEKRMLYTAVTRARKSLKFVL
ncbi:MAG: ATP-dependent RecD-like DNA helicase [Mycoplasmataceae bacterium]|nr:ATP-dependent RecD-like DNA helicase [Mycoplasmataceae bacterium]